MITLDGSQGEGGGQILRTSLALSLVTGQAFRMDGFGPNTRNQACRGEYPEEWWCRFQRRR
jgi:RNA 3'-terminal phosphate cyclase (ATP)